MAARRNVVCKCKRCLLNRTLSFELPETLFPIFSNRGAQEFTILDQDRCGGAVLLDPNQSSSLLLKQQPLLGAYRRKTPVHPLTSPKQSYSELCVFGDNGSKEDKMTTLPSEADQCEHVCSVLVDGCTSCTIGLLQVSYFKQSYPGKGVPEELLTEFLSEAVEDQKATDVLDTGIGGLLSYTALDPPCDAAGYSGNVYYVGGTLFDQLSVGALIHPENIFHLSTYLEEDLPTKDFLWSSRRVSPVHVEVVGGLRLPGRAYCVSSASVHGRRVVSVRCHHHWVLLEDTVPVEPFLKRYKTQVEEDFISDQFTYDLAHLSPLVTAHYNCQPAAVALSPYHFGEAVVVMETGEMRRWRGDNLREERMREALGDISTQGSPHWWACAYGPHPQQLIIAEQAGVGLIDLRCPHLVKLLVLDSTSGDSASSIVCAMRPHPLHPMHCLVATDNRLILMDIRMESHPLLSIAHELEQVPQYIDVNVDWKNFNTTVLLAGPKSQDIWTANYSGGCAPEGKLIPLPHATALPHMLGCYGNLATKLHPLLGKSRVKEPWLAGLGFVGSKGKSVSAVQLSSCGDLFLEDWSYCSLSDAPPDEGEGRGRVVSMVIDSWCREVDEVEKMARMKEGKWRKRDVVRDWSKLMMYVTSDCPLDVCIKCFVYCHSTNKDVQELARKASEAPGGNKKGKCCICHSPLAVGPVCQDSEEEGEAKWPSLLDTFPVGPAEASLAESELGRKLLQQWPSTSQQVQESQEASQATASAPQSTEDSLIYKLLHSQN